MMHRPFRVLSKRGAFMGRSTRPLLRARFPLVSGRKERERERESARAFEQLSFFFSGLNFVSLKIPPTKKGERFSRLLNSNGSEFVCVCKSSQLPAFKVSAEIIKVGVVTIDMSSIGIKFENFV